MFRFFVNTNIKIIDYCGDIMQKRMLICYVMLISLASGLFFRLYYISSSVFLRETAVSQTTQKVVAETTRGFIYDCNMKPIVGEKSEYVALVTPSAESAKVIAKYLEGDERKEAMEKLKLGVPFKITLPTNEIYEEGLSIFTIPQRYEESQTCAHLIGHLDSEGNGAMGIEKSYNDFLKEQGEEFSVSYIKTSKKINPYTVNSIEDSGKKKGGVVLTIDKDIQFICERSMKDIKKGAVVVMDVNTGEIKAMASKPNFSPNNISQSLKKSDGPFLNRCITPYSVGSTFKLVIALSALEQGVGELTSFPCLGKVHVGGLDFGCHFKPGHGATDMKKAIAWSCNPYFIHLGLTINIQKARELAETMGFGTESYLCDGLISPKGYLQQPNELLGEAQIANFSFGQGKLMATPLQITQMISVIASGGKKVTPRLVLGTTQDGQKIEYEDNTMQPQQIVSEKNTKKIKEMMINAVENGSCNNAKPQIYTAGGKTASAQTGQFKDGEEIVHAWFAGFYPGEKPKYAITVLCEEGIIGGEVAAPVFAQICDGLLAMGKIYWKNCKNIVQYRV